MTNKMSKFKCQSHFFCFDLIMIDEKIKFTPLDNLIYISERISNSPNI